MPPFGLPCRCRSVCSFLRALLCYILCLAPKNLRRKEEKKTNSVAGLFFLLWHSKNNKPKNRHLFYCQTASFSVRSLPQLPVPVFFLLCPFFGCCKNKNCPKKTPTANLLARFLTSADSSHIHLFFLHPSGHIPSTSTLPPFFIIPFRSVLIRTVACLFPRKLNHIKVIFFINADHAD